MNTAERIADVQRGIVRSLAELEAMVGTLYDRFAERFPAFAGLWREMADEERAHATTVRSLLDVIDRGHVLLGVGHFRPEKVAEQVAFVRAALEESSQEVPLKRAVSLALTIETSMVEARFYTSVESDAPEFCRIAESMTSALRVHARRLHDLLERNEVEGDGMNDGLSGGGTLSVKD